MTLLIEKVETLIAELREFAAFANGPEPERADLMAAHLWGALSRVADVGDAACAINGRVVFVPSQAEQACMAELGNAKICAEFTDRRRRATAELRFEMIAEGYARYTRAYTGIVSAGSDAVKGLGAIVTGAPSDEQNRVTLAHLNLLCSRCEEFHLVVHSFSAVLELSLFWEMDWVRQNEAPAPPRPAPAPPRPAPAPARPAPSPPRPAPAPAPTPEFRPVLPSNVYTNTAPGGAPIAPATTPAHPLVWLVFTLTVVWLVFASCQSTSASP